MSDRPPWAWRFILTNCTGRCVGVRVHLCVFARLHIAFSLYKLLLIKRIICSVNKVFFRGLSMCTRGPINLKTLLIYFYLLFSIFSLFSKYSHSMLKYQNNRKGKISSSSSSLFGLANKKIMHYSYHLVRSGTDKAQYSVLSQPLLIFTNHTMYTM